MIGFITITDLVALICIAVLAVGAVVALISEPADKAAQSIDPWADPESLGPAQDLHTCPVHQTWVMNPKTNREGTRKK